MEFVVQTVDVAQHLQQRVQPVLLVKRPPGCVQHTMVDWDKLTLAPTATGELVRVPLFAHRTSSKDPLLLVAAALRLAVLAADKLYRLVPPAAVTQCGVYLGHECTDLEDAWRFYLGLTFCGHGGQ